MVNSDILYLIIRYVNIKILNKISNIILYHPDYWKLKYYKAEPFSCVSCGEKVISCKNENGIYHNNWCISDHNNGEEYYFCSNCKYVYQSCPKCSNDCEIILCQFVGFNGMFICSIKYRLVNAILINEFLKELPDFQKYLKNGILEFDVAGRYIDYINQLDKKFIEILNKIEKKIEKPCCKYSTVDLNLEYFNVSDCYPTGVFCYFFHYWKCKNCKTVYRNGYEN